MAQQIEFRGQTYQFPDGTTKEQAVDYFRTNAPITPQAYPSENQKKDIPDKSTAMNPVDMKWSETEEGRNIDFSFGGVIEAIDRPFKALESAVSAGFEGKDVFKAAREGLTKGTRSRLSDIQFSTDLEEYGPYSKVPALKAAATETLSRVILDPLNVVGGVAVSGARKLTQAVSAGTEKLREITGLAKEVAPIGKESEELSKVIAHVVPSKGRPTKTREAIDKMVKPMSARVKELNPKIYTRWMKMEYDSMVNSGLYLDHVKGLKKQYKKLNKNEKVSINQALANGTWDDIAPILAKKPKLAEELAKARSVLNDMEGNILKAGENVPMIENYWPILVRDPTLLNKSIGPGEKLRDKIIARAKSKKKKGEIFTDRDIGQVFNTRARGSFESTLPEQSFLKERIKPRYSAEETAALASPVDALQSYIRQMSHHLEKAKFFGTKGFKDVDDSLGRLMAKEIMRPGSDFTLDKADEVFDVLHTRFGAGERTPNKFVGAMKNLFYIDALGQPTSAATQLGDLGVSVYVNGMYDTLASVFGKRYLDREAVGITDIARDMADVNATGRLLNNVLKATQFKRIDSFGKDVFLNASFRKIGRQMKTQKGLDTFIKKYKGSIPDVELDRMARGFANLKSSTITPEMRFLSWMELAKVQPITMAEMPEMYAKHPNGRIFYSLMSFTLKQVELLRDTSTRKMISGSSKEKIEGAKNLMKLGLAMGIANTGAEEVKNLMRGRPFDPAEEGTQRIMYNFLKNYGVSSWMMRDIKKGKLAQALVPSVSLMSRTAEDVWKSGGAILEGDYPAARVWRHVPVMGELIYNKRYGGTEKFMDRLEKEKQAKTPRAKAQRKRKEQLKERQR